jgi:hypothetical protein
MSNSEGARKLKPYAVPALTVHGDVREITRAVARGGSPDGKTTGGGNKVFKTG